MVQVVEQRIDIEKERLCLEFIKEDERIMTRDSSGMSKKHTLFLKFSRIKSLQDKNQSKQLGLAHGDDILFVAYFGSYLFQAWGLAYVDDVLFQPYFGNRS